MGRGQGLIYCWHLGENLIEQKPAMVPGDCDSEVLVTVILLTKQSQAQGHAKNPSSEMLTATIP